MKIVNIRKFLEFMSMANAPTPGKRWMANALPLEHRKLANPPPYPGGDPRGFTWYFHYWQFNYADPFTEGYNNFNCRHCASDIIKNVRTFFQTSDTTLLNALYYHWRENYIRSYSKRLWRNSLVWPEVSLSNCQ